MVTLNQTHDPKLRSWVDSANQADTDFPIQNLPFCMFSQGGGAARAGAAIGDDIFDLCAAADLKLIDEAAPFVRACTGAGLNSLMAADRNIVSRLRARLSALLSSDSKEVIHDRSNLVVQRSKVQLQLPAEIGGFTDFFTSLYHTERGGRINRPDNPVPENFRYMPIAYNSRASSVRISGEEVRRPMGQRKNSDGTVEFAPTKSLDFELELGGFIGNGNQLGERIPIGQADSHIFGYCLLNDWSTRDVQRWESFPLGPFLAKTLSTTISPFVITSEALAPFRTAASTRPAGDPAPLPYLLSQDDQRHGGIDLVMEAYIQTTDMNQGNQAPFRVTRTNFKDMYWTVAQMVAHHASNGCNFRTGDLFGSGTASGPVDESRGCLAEITTGRNPIDFPNGEKRIWLEDGDTVIFKARAERAGYVSIGFGDCSGRILPVQP
ncbi:MULTISPECIES: fumarylacetoacetase [unclassified Bradyrhizobium]|uniref:fumarylacetoacetase n=1 Tax=unclassified Bradyrhizobium TaxID=2631580 RepID=UPI002305BB57|nr:MULTISPECIES: fumarylacetoacetase [unclassified Bradyrhizobium]MDA9451229.1 hypothetical protein [Bradyrhizobium sp. CCBAU 21360]MDA9457608.1 hypothetical protein [Bradyrhizobium sp. CCBAU 21359]